MKREDLKAYLKRWPVWVAFLIVLAGVLGSLYASEVAKLPPCDLCWYQRIALYPLLPIMLVGVMRKVQDLPLFVLPLALFGWVVALYHYGIQKLGVEQLPIGCGVGAVSCTDVQIEVAGFVTFPLLSLGAFTVIIVAAYLMHRFGVKYD